MLARRLVQLYAGLVLYGASAALILLSSLGNDPWDVLHQGLSRQTGLSVGAWIIIAARSCCCCGSRCASGRGSGRSAT